MTPCANGHKRLMKIKLAKDWLKVVNQVVIYVRLVREKKTQKKSHEFSEAAFGETRTRTPVEVDLNMSKIVFCLLTYG